MKARSETLARRLGKSVHVSALDYKLRRMMGLHLSPDAECIEDWLIDVANARGCRVVERPHASGWKFVGPHVTHLSNEELVVAICGLQRLDRPQMLRLAAQMISRGAVGTRRLIAVAERERVGAVLGELARQALRVDPDHAGWREISLAFPVGLPLRDSLIHWSRLAEPVMADGRISSGKWLLVA